MLHCEHWDTATARNRAQLKIKNEELEIFHLLIFNFKDTILICLRSYFSIALWSFSILFEAHSGSM